MSRTYNYYAPINQALENFNRSLERSNQRRMEHEYQQQRMKYEHAIRLANLKDPRNQLAIQKARRELEPQTINLKSYMPSNMQDKPSVEKYNEFKSYLPSFTNGKGANIREDGVVVDAHNQPLQMPRFQARQVNNRIQFTVAANQNGIAEKEREIEKLKLQREAEKSRMKNLPPNQLKLKLGGYDAQIETLKKDLDNPKFRLMELDKTRRSFMNLYQRAALDNSDPEFLNALKYKIEGINDQMEMLLPAKGLKNQLVFVYKKEGGDTVKRRVPYSEVSTYEQQGWKAGVPQYKQTVSSRKNSITINQGYKQIGSLVEDIYDNEAANDVRNFYTESISSGVEPIQAINDATQYAKVYKDIQSEMIALQNAQKELKKAQDPFGPNFMFLDDKKVAEAHKKVEIHQQNILNLKGVLNQVRSSGVSYQQRVGPVQHLTGGGSSFTREQAIRELEEQGVDTSDPEVVEGYMLYRQSNE
ncbi:MAG: hypothetical protein KQI78_12205 [Deltaproteobacteria bacterium]|nr:hypothetical protein [Deltaproteobacteria bacterium]